MSKGIGAIRSDEAQTLLAPLRRFGTLVLAVSGGPDSLALMVLAAEWRAGLASKAPAIRVATVDHKLRPQAAGEAEAVAGMAAACGLPHTTLEWMDVKPATGLINAARDARYRLLGVYAASLAVAGPVAIVTAHTEDDQAETFLMRLARGAGAEGLSAMAGARPLEEGSGLELVRPLLGISKARLIATLEARGLAWIEDPTNAAVKYERVRIRGLIERLEDAGLTRHAIATSARRLGDARAALKYATAAFEGTLAVSYNDDVFAALARPAFDQGPAILRQRVLAGLIDRFGGASPAPELAEVEALAGRLARDQTMQATLGGAVVSANPQSIRIWREVGRIGDGEVSLAPGTRTLWDERFWVSALDGAAGPVDVRPLGHRGLARVRNEAQDRPHLWTGSPADALAALPSFWDGGTLLAVPPLLAGETPNGAAGPPENPMFLAVPRYGS